MYNKAENGRLNINKIRGKIKKCKYAKCNKFYVKWGKK